MQRPVANTAALLSHHLETLPEETINSLVSLVQGGSAAIEANGH